MSNKLKKRFIIFSMISVTVLLVFIIIAINGLNWFMLSKQSDMMVESLLADKEGFDKNVIDRPPPDIYTFVEKGMRAKQFFVVYFDDENNISYTDTKNIPPMENADAEEYAVHAIKTAKKIGKIDGYKYAVREFDGGTKVVFLDVSDQNNMLLIVMLVSCAIGVVCWITVLLIVILLSGKVIMPVLQGIEKQKQFITNAGHEMKTPLAIIQSNNDTMALIHGENKYNIHISNQTKRLNKLMTNLLVLSRLDEDICFEKECVDVSEMADKLLPAYIEEANRRDILFDAKINEGITLNINRENLSQLMTALLDNAVKYTRSGGKIGFCLSADGKRVRIVEENSCDVPAEPDTERLFERFYRGDKARTQDGSTMGFGIGLSSARAICENFGGKLTAEYVDGCMIRFTAVL